MTGTSAPPLVFREVDKTTWLDFVRLFEGEGGPRDCWCMMWRDMPKPEEEKAEAERKAAMAERVRDGVPIGLLGYADGEPVAWCSIAPRSTYRRAVGGLEVAGEAPGSVWSLACFYVASPFRGKGLTRKLVSAALEHARSNGAQVVEAYPVYPDSPNYHFMGFVGTFVAMDFAEVGRAGRFRHVMRRNLQGPE